MERKPRVVIAKVDQIDPFISHLKGTLWKLNIFITPHYWDMVTLLPSR